MKKPVSVHLDDERTRPDSPDQATFQHHLARYQFAARQLTPGGRVLDAGCGTGYGTHLLSETAALAVGADYSLPGIAYARQNFHRANLHYAVMDCHHIAFPDGFFDAIVCFELYEHLEQSDLFLNECKRVLRSGGTLILSTPNQTTSDIHMASIHQTFEFHINMADAARFREVLNRHFAAVDIFGQRKRGNALYSALRALDVFNLRLRLVRPTTREELQKSMGVPVGRAAGTEAWIFSKRQLRQSNNLVAVCRKQK